MFQIFFSFAMLAILVFGIIHSSSSWLNKKTKVTPVEPTPPSTPYRKPAFPGHLQQPQAEEEEPRVPWYKRLYCRVRRKHRFTILLMGGLFSDQVAWSRYKCETCGKMSPPKAILTYKRSQGYEK